MNRLQPLFNRLQRLAGARPDFWSLAAEVWEAAPAEDRSFPPAIWLDGQLDRIRETVFGDLPGTIAAFTATGPQPVGPTLAARFHDVILSDGVLYKGGAEFHLLPRRHRRPVLQRPEQELSGAIYDSWVGLRYFGNWLMDDCETYRLAEAVGQPITLRRDSAGHRAGYEARLAITPCRVGAARFRDLVLFADLQNNTGKLARAADRRARLLAGRGPVAPHPGVFLLRGRTGDPRLLLNEAQLAEGLARRHGIRVLHAEDHTVDELIAACAGARVLIGIEGSQLTHALVAMPAGGTMLSLMPPDRVTAAMKLHTDRLGLHYALVIGTGTAHGFTVAEDEVEATLQHLP